MKKYKSKILTMMLASCLGAAAFGGAVAVNADTAKSEGVVYTPSRVFVADKAATVDADKDTATDLAFTFKSGSNVSFKRDLALKWYENNSVKYLSMKFAFADKNFLTQTLTFETASDVAVKEDKAVNKVIFENKEGNVTVCVNDGEKISVDTTKDIVLTLSEKVGSEVAEHGEFFVIMNNGGEDTKIGSFLNMGANFAEYFSASSSTPRVPFSFEAALPADVAADATSKIIFKELNGQSFVLNENGSIVDNAAPVLVVNEEINSFILGMNFSLDYKTLDVLDTSVDKVMEYYQYNPADKGTETRTYKTLTTSTYFMDTVYTDERGNSTSVYNEDGQEYVSVKFKLSDDTHTGDNAKEYYLSWYANETVKPAGDTTTTIDYIRADRKQGNPFYVGIVNDDEAKTTTVQAEANELAEAFQASVVKNAEGLYAGSNSYFYLPSMKGMIGDKDTDYNNLEFDIFYRTKTSSNQSTENLASNKLKISLAIDGMYEFKVLATNKLGNQMYYYKDGEKTIINSSNIWDVEEIPSFTFSVSNNGIKIEENKDIDSGEGFIDVTYTFSDFTVTALPGYSKEYSLYYFDTTEYQRQYAPNFSVSDLNRIKYEDLKNSADLSQVKDNDYLAYFAELYINKLNALCGATVKPEQLMTAENGKKAIFRKIEAYDSSINEDKHPDEWKNSDNKYYWNESARSFKPQEVGSYVLLGVFTDSELAGEKAPAYKTISVNAKIDTIKGETQWLKNNIASVILFSIAGVLFIIVIILFLVKPSDETLEEVGNEKAKKSKKDKQNKK